jgi:hypothetical protein
MPFNRLIWFLFFTQPFWGFFLPTSIPFWFLLMVVGLFYRLESGIHWTTYEKVLVLIPLASFLGWIVTGSFTTGSLWPARQVLQTFLFAFGVLSTIQDRDDVLAFVSMGKWFALGALLLSFYSLLAGRYFTTGHFDLTTGMERAGGWTEIPNAFSSFIVLSVLFSWFAYAMRKSLPALAVFLVSLLMLLTTLSRNGILSVVGFVVVWFGIGIGKSASDNRGSRFTRMFKLALALGAVSIVLSELLGPLVVGTMTRDIRYSGGELSNMRLSFWLAHLSVMPSWNALDLIFGINYHMIGSNLRYGLENNLGIFLSPQTMEQVSYVENGFLYVLLGSGILGFALLTSLIVISVRSSKAILGYLGNAERRIAVFVLAAIVAFVIQSMLMDFAYLSVTVYYYTLMGLSVRLSRSIGSREKVSHAI